MLLLALASAAAMARASRGQAQASHWELIVDAPADSGCSNAATISRRVEARAGNSSASRTRIVVQVRRPPEGPGWSASVRTLDRLGQPVGSRELRTEAADCSALDAGLVLVVAAVVGIALDPPQRVEAPAEAPPPLREDVVHQAVESRQPLAAASLEPAEPWRFGVGLGARAISGLLPGAALGVAAGVTGSHGAFQFHASGMWLPSADMRVGARGESHFWVALGELDLCGIAARPLRGTLAFCAGGQGGVMSGEASGLWIQRASQHALVQAVPSARASLPLAGALSVQTAVGATIPLVFPSYSYVDPNGRSRSHHHVEPGLWAELGIGLWFGS